jgi:Ser/Thr protein kinase RdoA (MazF antagonist)
MLAIVRVEHQGRYYGGANARLIAAAPDFFEAATKLIEAFDELKSMTTAERIITGRSDADLRKASEEAIAGLRDAIAKAEGRS